MKKIFKHTSIIVLALLFALCIALPTFAEDGTVTYTGGGNFTFGPGTDMSATQLFPDLEGVMPGDTLTQKVTITNQSGKTDVVKFYLRAEAHDDSSNPLETGVKNTETVASMEDFLSQLSMTVKNGDETIFEASPEKTDGLTDNVYLGTLKKGESIDLIVTLSVPADLGNEYANRSGEVDWVFTVEELNEDASIDLTMTETSKPKDKNGYQEGEEITYDIVVTNNGNVTLLNVVVTDPETGATFTVEKLEPGESATFKTSHKVTEEDVKAGSFTNTASVTATADNPDIATVKAGPVKVTSKTYKEPAKIVTGDTAKLGLWIGICAASAALVIIVIILLVVKRKKKDS